MIQVVLCNCPPDAAPNIADALITEHLAACVNLFPGVRSVYRWEGKVCHDEETTLFIKTTSEKFTELERRITEIHPYDTPEIVALNAAAVAKPYADWVNKEVDDETNT